MGNYTLFIFEKQLGVAKNGQTNEKQREKKQIKHEKEASERPLNSMEYEMLFVSF